MHRWSAFIVDSTRLNSPETSDDTEISRSWSHQVREGWESARRWESQTRKWHALSNFRQRSDGRPLCRCGTGKDSLLKIRRRRRARETRVGWDWDLEETDQVRSRKGYEFVHTTLYGLKNVLFYRYVYDTSSYCKVLRNNTQKNGHSAEIF